MNKNKVIKIFSIAALAILLLLMPLFLNNVYWVSILVIVGINVLLTSSLRTIMLLDNPSLGHVGYMLIGGYCSALLVMKVGIPFWAALVLAGLLSGFIALALGYPFLRLKGVYFAVITLMTAEVFRTIAWSWKSLTGGQQGLVRIPSPSFWGIVDLANVNNYYYVVLFIVMLSLLILYRLEHSPLGFKWRAIRDADILAMSVGMNVMWYKILNFAIASFFAGIAGALFAFYQHALSADAQARFGVLMSLHLMIYMVVGGQNKFAGPIIGASTMTILSELARPLEAYQPMLMGGIAVIIALFMPEGLISLPERIKPLYTKLLKRGNT